MEALASSFDDFSTAFEDRRFRENYKQTISNQIKWCNLSECNPRQKDLIGKLQRTEDRLQSILLADNLAAQWNQYMSNRKLIKDIFIELLRHEMKFCRQNNVEQHFWKVLYYNLIECGRRFVNKKTTSTTTSTAPTTTTTTAATNKSHRQFCMRLIDDGVQFFTQILEILSKTYGYTLDDYIGVESGKNLRGLRYISLALVSAQKCIMYLGDLARYRELIEDANNHFREAERYYMTAYQLIPSNGMPLNQLAVLALYNKKNFNAIYYHMRSLNASNPIKSARESLIILFDELHKKYQSQSSNQLKRSGLSSVPSKLSTLASPSSSSSSPSLSTSKKNRTENFKREIWVHPTDGQLNYRTVYLDQEDESLDVNDLYKNFIFNFSHLHGILFTKVGVDSLECCIEQTLKQFQQLLNHLSNMVSVLTLRKMVQMIIINIYSIENDINSVNDTLLPFALTFSFTFTAIILNKLQFELNEIATDDFRSQSINGIKQFQVKQIDKFNLSDDINGSLAALSMWCNWMKKNWHLWTNEINLSAIHKYAEQYGLYIWEDFARLVTVLEKFYFQIDDDLLMHNEPIQIDDQFKRIRLTEDMLALGMPSVIRNDNIYCRKHLNEKNAFSILRWQNIYKFCTNELMNDELTFLHRLDFGEIIASQLWTTHIGNDESDNIDEFSSIQIHDEEHGIEENALELLMDDDQSDEIKELLQRRNELKQTHQIQKELNQYTETLLQRMSSQNVCMEIRPKYLITDTNCFIDFLPQIKQLSQVYPLYNVLIPIVVLNELEGLAKGECGSDVVRDTKTSLNAQEAFTFLKSSNSFMKCVTTRGSILKSMTFTKESDCPLSPDGRVEHFCNDDKILLTAVNLTKLHSNEMARDQKPISISNLQRKVILLTNDRNLKLKAITQNIPVRELIDFIKWSGIVK